MQGAARPYHKREICAGMTPEELATRIKRLNARELARLNQLLRDLPGWGTAGAREPRRPTPPLDAVGVALSAEKGKTHTRGS